MKDYESIAKDSHNPKNSQANRQWHKTCKMESPTFYPCTNNGNSVWCV